MDSLLIDFGLKGNRAPEHDESIDLDAKTFLSKFALYYQSLDSILINIRPMLANRSLRCEPSAKDFRSNTNVKVRTDSRSVLFAYKDAQFFCVYLSKLKTFLPANTRFCLR